MDRSRLSRAIKGAIATATVSASFATLSFAQEVEEVVVTGTRIQRATDATSTVPITVFDAAALENSGETTLEDFLQELPSMTGGQFGSSVNNGNPGLATVSLRGLGSSRSLVLLNGRRLVSAGTLTGTVDLNTIPISIIDRVEILKSGASSIYGSDAIAGVVNIITKKDFEGAQIRADYGITDESDGEQWLASMTFGAETEKGHVMLNVEYTKRDDIFQGDRKFSQCPLAEGGGQVFCFGSGTTTPAQFFTDNPDDPGFIVDPTTGQVRPFQASDGFNFAEFSYLITPQEVFSIYGYGEHELWDIKNLTTINAFSELLYTNRQSDQLLAPEGTFWGPGIAADNPFNPIGEPVFVTRRLTEAGGRSFTQDLSTWRGVIGFNGEWCNDWLWDISYTYARWVDPQIDRGRANQTNMDTLLASVNFIRDDEGNIIGEEFASADCPEDPNCGIWNPFDPDTLTEDMIEFGLVTNSPVEKETLRSFQINVTGDFGGFALTSEAWAWAAGYEHRSESVEVTVDGAAQLGQIYFVQGTPWSGSYSVDEGYVEVRAPVLEGQRWADLLAFEVSARYSDYDTIGDDTTFAAIVEYAPFEELRFRGSYNEGFRAPGLDDLFSPAELSAERYSDPCFEATDPTVIANCNADSPSLINSPQISGGPQATGFFAGNPDLDKETSESWTLGAVWTPTFVEDLSFTLDYWRIDVEDAIGTFTTDQIVDNCYASASFPNNDFCNLILGPTAVGQQTGAFGPRRAANATIAGQALITQNISTFETDGVDLGAFYNWDFWEGNIAVQGLATYLHDYKFQASAFDPEINLAGKFGADPVTTRIAAFPRWKLYMSADYEADYWSVGTTVRMEGRVDDISPNTADLATQVDSTWYQDIRAAYFCWEDVKISGGIRNVWNQQPPYVTNYDDMNTLPLNYDTIGRFFYGSITLSF
ncbi:TonB-dependent receptor plug domain-containing protein [Microbulbifer thermotolerans]|uniref:TonB-dependent receptor plug domain-containing protein n=1 Tax=Microbulbifer thermotolerans TaxID=252514 RepID=UPI00224AE6C5|nr:TonB-dependent receptor [Microbulbifer thermotolerans]MCX2780055.1 TonB-dependent receptor [Microbulbifer thermotolerans]MCX2805479.1 TonB-dependent receptor [Microbulbifer thermotolerans]